MSENQPLPNSLDAPLVKATDAHLETGQSQSETEAADAAQLEVWEPAPIPGTLSAASNSETDGGIDNSAIASEREGELLALIHDLNQCNDVLLSRVTQLESSLEKSQATLKYEAAQAEANWGRMAQQMSAEQASATQISQQAQQQIARLVSDLEVAERALSRQQLINENLQTEVDNNQERISQLERECTAIAQQRLDEVQARTQAEAVGKDLRSRLQRQQRYTMQFKAALEKSLTVTTRSSDMTSAQPVSFSDSAAVAMPKAQRIMPWVSDNSSPFAGIDPHLESLIRGAGKPTVQSKGPEERFESHLDRVIDLSSKAESAAKAAAGSKMARPSDAEDKLWQDLERVMSVEEAPAVEQVSAPEPEQADRSLQIDSDLQTDAVDTPAVPIPPALEQADETVSDADANRDQANELIHQIETSFAAANRQSPEPEVAFTEPSPWGQPLSARAEEGIEKMAAVASYDEASDKAEKRENEAVEETYLPALDGRGDAAISPLVNPLRSQKKTGSLSGLELPTFQNAKIASFRR